MPYFHHKPTNQIHAHPSINTKHPQLPAWVQQDDEEGAAAAAAGGASRYRHQHKAEEDEDDEAADRARRRERGRRRYEAEVVVEGEGEGEGEEQEEVERKPVPVVDRRLARLEEARRVAQEGRGGGRWRHEAEVVAGPEDKEEEEEGPVGRGEEVGELLACVGLCVGGFGGLMWWMLMRACPHTPSS